MKKQSAKRLLTLLFVLTAAKGFSQPAITGTHQIKRFVSNGQVQQKGYKGTGYWKVFPCLSCAVIIIKKDSVKNINKVVVEEARLTPKAEKFLRPLGAYITYTNKAGAFSCVLREFEINDEVLVIYGNATDYKQSLRLNAKTNAGLYTQ